MLMFWLLAVVCLLFVFICWIAFKAKVTVGYKGLGVVIE